jgi:hypothetical protein
MLLVLDRAVFLGSESFGSRDHILLSVLRLPFSSPPTTRRVTVEIFDLTSTRVAPLPMNYNPFIISRRPEYRSSCRTISCHSAVVTEICLC